MRLLILNYEYPPVGSGGGVISKFIADGLAKIGWDITVITTWFEGLEEKETTENLTIIRLHSKRQNLFRSNPVEMLSWSKHSKFFLEEYCKSNRFDFCLANFVLPGGDVARFLRKKLGLRYAVISHGHDVPWVKPTVMYFYHTLTYLWIKKICTAAEVSFVQTEQMKGNIDRFVGSRHSVRNIMIPNGMDAKLCFPDYSKRPSKLRILFTGRLASQKNPIFFMRVLKDFALKCPEFEVVIMGDGPLRFKMEGLAGCQSLSDKVRFIGKVSYEDAIDNYKSANVVVVPSVSEGMSIANLECLACGCYLFTTPVSGNPDMVEQGVNGELINSNDSRFWAGRLEAFYKEKYVENYRVPGDFVEAFRNKFNWDGIVRRYAEVLSEVVKD